MPLAGSSGEKVTSPPRLSLSLEPWLASISPAGRQEALLSVTAVVAATWASGAPRVDAKVDSSRVEKRNILNPRHPPTPGPPEAKVTWQVIRPRGRSVLVSRSHFRIRFASLGAQGE